MVRRITFIALLAFLSLTALAQQKVKIDIDGSQSKPKCTEFVEESENKLVISELISGIELIEKKTKDGPYVQIQARGLNKTYDAGKPELPVISRLIEIPANCDVEVKLLFYDEQIIELKDYGVDKLIRPAQVSRSKSQDEKDVPFEKDAAVYSKDEFYQKDVVKFVDRGFLRKKHLGYIEISPFAYNPVTNTLKVLYNIDVEITFVPKKNGGSKDLGKLNSPYFNDINYNTINSLDNSKELISGPVKYVIVSDRMFEETLDPFIEWKTMKGFNVIEAYTDDIGTTTTAIKAHLKDLYDNPADGVSPTFVLFVGDIDQVPSFGGSAGSHVTDLYYCEYTDDDLPEVYYGRFSAETVEELQSQIDKTLEVEKYEMPDPSYLDNVVLVAGVDWSYASTYGNGAINYANEYYTNSDNGINSSFYLFNDESGIMASNDNQASFSIRNHISQGVSFVNYTAHCNYYGWEDPAFRLEHIDAMTNEHMYPLIISNCCLSSKFDDDDCFGEKILIAQDKGAVGYIGGSNSTYWSEDFYWGIGLAAESANPTYENSGLGVYDRFFHSNGEAKEDWYITQGQINIAGNLAVESSASGRKTYYWEIYHLMGDPSLTPYVTVPSVLVASYNSEFVVGWSSINVTAEEDAYVAVSRDGVLLDAKLVDETGEVELNCDLITEPGHFDIVITKQNRQPIIDEITVIPETGPYLVLDGFAVDDSEGNGNGEVDYGETIKFDIRLENLSDAFDAFHINTVLRSTDTNIILLDTIGPPDYAIGHGTTMEWEGIYLVKFKDKFQDQQKVSFTLKITGTDAYDDGQEYEWNSSFDVTVNAPEIEYGDFWIENDGNGNGIIDPGESGDLCLVIKNIGHASIGFNADELNTSITYDPNKYTFNQIHQVHHLDALSTDTVIANITANSDVPIETVAVIGFGTCSTYGCYYQTNIDKEFIIGEVPVILITDEDAVISGFTRFYDSGGPDDTYGKDEYESITIRSGVPGKALMVDFISFNVEENTFTGGCYDHIDIFNGANLSTLNLIGEYCNENPPTIIISDNDDGALTFRFNSDGSAQFDGWEAEISLYEEIETYYFQVTVMGGNGLIEDATVEFNGETKVTDATGVVQFDDILAGTDYSVKITADGYNDYETTIDIDNDISKQYDLELTKYEVKFVVIGPDDKSIDNVEVDFNNEIKYTDTDGEIVFIDILPENDIPFLIKKDSYDEYDGAVTVVDEDIVLTAKLTLSIGIPSIEIEDLKIYPNPSSGVFYIEFSNSRNEACQVKVYDIMGSVIYNKHLKGSFITDNINISQKAKGIYFLSVELDNGSVTKRIIVK